MLKKAFNINNTLYPDALILQAIDAFSDYQIQLIASDIVIEDEDPQYIFDELMNYILSLSLE